MPALNTTRQNGIVLVALLFAQLLLMSGSVKHSDGSTRLESWTMRVSSPVILLARSVSGAFGDAIGGVRDLLLAHSRSRVLEAEVRRLSADVERYREAALENGRLRRLLTMREDLVPRSVGASVVTWIATRRERMIVVDRGFEDGIRPDLPVVAWGGAVGRVVAVERAHSKVLLLSDPNSGVAGIVQRSRAQGMVFGRGDDHPQLELRYVPRFSDVEYGDRVVTSGLDGIFPRGFGVGTVISVQPAADGSQTVYLDPQLDYRSVEEVLILLEPVGGDLLAPAGLEDRR